MTATLHFPMSEYDRRIQKTRAEMARRGFDLLVVSDPSNMAWLTGYDGWSFYVHQAVLLGLEGEPVWWGRKMDGNGALRTCFMAPDNIAGYPDIYVQNPERHPMEHLAALIAERRLTQGRVGVELDNYWYTAAAHAALGKGLGAARLGDATGLVNWQRLVKSDQEVAFIRRAARIVERMHALIFAMVEPGLPKNRLVAEIYKVAVEGAEGAFRRLPGDRADAAVRHGRDRPPSHLGRPAVQGGRGNVLRDRRLLPALSLPAVAHGLSRCDAAEILPMPSGRC